MVMRKVKLLLVYFTVLSTAVFFTQCTFKEDIENLNDSFDDFKVYIASPEFSTGARFEFVDAKTDQIIEGSLITLTVTGKDNAIVYNNMGEQLVSYKTQHGQFELVIDEHKVNPATIQKEPILFDVTAVADGYLTATQNVILSQANSKIITVRLVSLTNQPEGVAVAVQDKVTTTNSTGKVEKTATVSLNSGAQEVVIPAGVILRDENGQVLPGKINTKIVSFDPTNAEALKSVPGGMNVVATMPGGTTESVSFDPAGIMFVTFTADDKKVKSFAEGGVKISTKVSPKSINPKTKLPFKENDVIALWSLDEGSGKWKFEKNETVQRVSGELVFTTTLTHLSGYLFGSTVATCTSVPVIQWKGLSALSQNEELQVIISSDFSSDTKIVTLKGQSISLDGMPSGIPVKIEIKNHNNIFSTLSFSPAILNITNNCTNQVYDVTVTETKNTGVEFVTVNFDLLITAESANQVGIQPTTRISSSMVYNSKTIKKTIDLIQGKSRTSFVLNTPYKLSGTYGNDYGEGELRIIKVDASNYRVTLTPLSFGSATAAVPYTLTIPKNSDGSIDVRYNANVK